MPCYHPIGAVYTGAFHPSGKRVIAFNPSAKGTQLQVPCGRCIGCKLEHSRQWAVRIMHERQLHERAYFLTLTYDDEHLPSDHSLNKEHLQKFFKRYRKSCGKLRYYACGEYGEQTLRPHYHACIFGHEFPDLLSLEAFQTDNPFPTYTSPSLSKLWPFGSNTIGALTFESAAYVARYCTKKITGEKAEQHYTRVIESTGEIVRVEPEFATMSLKPGIGSQWFEKYSREVYPHDRVVINHREAKPPKYYDKLLERKNLELFENIKEKRVDKAKNKAEDTLARRITREQHVKLKQAAFNRRKL
jgi:hypothetical protein